MGLDFCGCCDYGPNGFNDCPPTTKDNYAGRRCGWAGIGGVRVMMTKDGVIIPSTEEEIRRDNLDKLRKAIYEQQEQGNAPWRTPKESAFERELKN